MNALHAVVLGTVQGLTEFLPVSSSAHLALFPWFLGWRDQGLAFDVALHWGTLLSLVVYFREDLAGFAKAALSGKDSAERRLAFGLALATVPAAVAGVLLDDAVETVFRGPHRIAGALALFGLLLGAADRWGKKSLALTDMDWRFCLAVGAAQALAIVPGVSRSGVTLTAALALGLGRVDAARFSFLLAIPIVAGAGLMKLKDLGGETLGAPVLLGIAASALSGYFAIRFLIGFLKDKSLGVFAVYRVLLAAFIFFVLSGR